MAGKLNQGFLIPDHFVNQNGASCVLMSLVDYKSLDKTAYLMRSPANAKRLMSSIESLKAGG
ncbi:antitoxin YefM [Enterobacter bugandensis]|nr:antitoxin YefM [Enterobacter bugandensis]